MVLGEDCGCEPFIADGSAVCMWCDFWLCRDCNTVDGNNVCDDCRGDWKDSTMPKCSICNTARCDPEDSEECEHPSETSTADGRLVCDCCGTTTDDLSDAAWQAQNDVGSDEMQGW